MFNNIKQLIFISTLLFNAIDFAVAQCGPNRDKPYLPGTMTCPTMMMMGGDGGASGSTSSNDCPASDGQQVCNIFVNSFTTVVNCLKLNCF
jgi:hypothetical protein